ncbi:ABC transporter ATP-binding protein [Streptomyces sp. NPDC001508]|uniref:ABC transporter ATP-binding protein n=1 Tax=Streptomyces sp. NPDC001508 TaxID=3154656 RepID=UPI0033291DE1
MTNAHSRRNSAAGAAPGPVPAARLSAAVKAYEAGGAAVRALDHVNLEVPAGSWTAVMGPSGSGKSTLLHCMAGLERLDAGQAVLGGRDITAAAESELTRLRRRQIGFVFQNFNLIASFTAEQNVALPLRLAGARPSGRDVRAALDAVGLGDRARHRPAELSGGQQQRVAIARALVTRPAVLFADEPTGALDTKSARAVLDLLGRMTAAGQTIVMVTHDPVSAACADTVVFLRDGRIADRLTRPSAALVAGRLAGLEG